MKRDRTLYRLLGPAPDTGWRCYNNSKNNMVNALVRRMFKIEVHGRFLDPPPPDVCAWETTSDISKLFVECLPRRPKVLTHQEFIDGCSDPRKRTVYTNAAKSLEVSAVQPKDAHMQAFVKCQKETDTKYDPRPIQPRSARYGLEVGCFVRPMESLLYKAIDEVFIKIHGPHHRSKLRTVVKGVNAEKAASMIREKWEMFAKPRAIMLDMKRFEQCVSVPALRWTHFLYNLLWRSPKLKKLLSWVIHNKGWARVVGAFIRYCLEGHRTSGDMDTSLGNNLLMAKMLGELLLETGLCNVEVILNGDDCGFIGDEADLLRLLPLLEGHFLKHGFRAVVEPMVDVFERISFCQMRPVCVDGVWRLVREPWNALAKDLLTVMDISHENEARKWANSVGLCGLAMASGVPVHQALYERLAGTEFKGRDRIKFHPGNDTDRWWSRGLSSKARPVEPSTRISYFLAFNVPPGEQEALERQYAAWEPQFDVGPYVPNSLRGDTPVCLYGTKRPWSPVRG